LFTIEYVPERAYLIPVTSSFITLVLIFQTCIYHY
jgi:hypothetical protein